VTLSGPCSAADPRPRPVTGLEAEWMTTTHVTRTMIAELVCEGRLRAGTRRTNQSRRGVRHGN